MEEETTLRQRAKAPKKGKRGSRPPRGAAAREKKHKFTLEVRLRAVKLHLEEGLTARLVSEQLGIGYSTLTNWITRYRKMGEEGLREQTHRPRSRRLPAAVQEKITQLKTDHPGMGVRRISHWLTRLFCLRASHETVRQVLQEKQLIEAPARRPQHNPAKPRFFERSQPNQMWQSDIFMFRLGGRQAYLIGFVDDYSRYVTGCGLFRSQTAECVLEVWRVAIAEYGVPKEMLTDNGRQYTNWRGTTRFEQELSKEHVKHFRSAPHHPMTLGKIERFWKTIWEEFLCRAQFGSYEEAQQRVRWWIQYYNHKRPHQGIEGLCPADRFFEIQHAMREALEQGIQQNILEMALRGKPRDPFYMVGRLGEQSVVIRAEKGRLRMLVDGEQTSGSQEMVYEMEKGDHDENVRETVSGAGQTDDAHDAQRSGEMPGGALDLGGATQAFRDLQGAGDSVGPAESVAGSGPGSDAASAGSAHPSGGRTRTGLDDQTGTITGEDSRPARREVGSTGESSGSHSGSQIQGAGERINDVGNEARNEDGNGEPICTVTTRTGSPPACRIDSASTQWRDHRGAGGAPVGNQSQDLLPMGTARAGGDDASFGAALLGRTAPPAGGPGEGTIAARSSALAPGVAAAGATPEGARDPGQEAVIDIAAQQPSIG